MSVLRRASEPALLVLALAAALAPAAAAARRPAAATASLAVMQSFGGLSQDDGGGYAPPDVQVAAGPGFVVEMVNLAAEIWSTTGGAPVSVSVEQLGTLFRSGPDALTDPRVLYDTASGRWFASVSDIDAGAVLLAVSSSGDPTGSWNVSSFGAGGGCADQPRLGTADGVVVLAGDLFTSCKSGSFHVVGSQLWIVNKAQLVAGAGSPAFTTYGPTATLHTMTPVQSLSPTATAYVVSVDSPSSTVVHLFSVTGIPPAPVTVREVATPAIAPLRPPPNAVEPGFGGFALTGLDTNDDRILDAAWEQGRLWFSADTACTPAGDTKRRACGRVAELSTADGTLTWQADVGFAGAYVFFPAIRPDSAGNLVVVYGESSAAINPEVAATARAPDGSFTAPAVVGLSAAPGSAQRNGGRWGDYFGAARDPSQPGVVWIAGETGGAAARGGGDWTTVVASAAVTADSTTPATVAPPPPVLRAEAGSGVAGKPLRLSFVALADGSGIRRQVTVRAGAKVVFRRTTKPAPLHARRVYSVTWRPPRKLGGRFRFCVRSIGHDGTQSAQTCAALRLSSS